jgi:hypothetical protein
MEDERHHAIKDSSLGKKIILLTPQYFSTQPENTHCHERTDVR